MYEQHFGFSRPLFTDTTVQGDAVYLSRATESLIRDLAVALARKNTVAILSGDSGTGKTTIALHALKELSTRLAFACISHAPASEHELLELFLNELCADAVADSRVERLQLWRQFLAEMAATDTRVCLLVENADQLSDAVLQSLHSLTAADAALTPGANIVLTSTRPAESLLRAPCLIGLKQRVRLRRHLLPLSVAETSEYLKFKCGLAEADAAAVFTADAAHTLHHLSGGVLRVIDNLLESALISAAAEGQPQVTGALIDRLAASHYGISQLTPAAVAELLEQSADAAGTGIGAAAPSDDDSIPTLTEYVIGTGRKEWTGRSVSANA